MYFDRTPSTFVEGFSGTAFGTGQPSQSGPVVAIVEQEMALKEGVSRKLYYNQLTTQHGAWPRG